MQIRQACAYDVPRMRGPMIALLCAVTTLAAWIDGAASAPVRPRSDGTATIPLPPPRPSLPGDPARAEPPVTTTENPTPPPRPTDLGSAESPKQPDAVIVERPPTDPAEEEACLGRLRTLGVQFEVLPAIAEGACGAARPLRVSRLTDEVVIAPPATMVCAMAEALTQWSRGSVLPEARRLLSATPRTLAIGTSYQCRTRNHLPGAKLSEHAFANAVDISGVTFAERAAVTIGSPAPATPEYLFARAIQAGACTSFHTVLGPGSDAEHGDHLHLDLRGRRNGYRICQ